MATHSSVLAWRIPGTGEPGRLPSTGSHRVEHDWSDLAAATPFLSFLWVLPLVHGKKAFFAQLPLRVNYISGSPLFSSFALLPPVDSNSPSPGSADRPYIFWVVLLRQNDSPLFLMEKWESRQEFTDLFFCLPWILLCNWPGSWYLRGPRVLKNLPSLFISIQDLCFVRSCSLCILVPQESYILSSNINISWFLLLSLPSLTKNHKWSTPRIYGEYLHYRLYEREGKSHCWMTVLMEGNCSLSQEFESH